MSNIYNSCISFWTNWTYICNQCKPGLDSITCTVKFNASATACFISASAHVPFSVYTHSHTLSLSNSSDSLTYVLTATSINRNFLEESRIIFQRRGIYSVFYFRKLTDMFRYYFGQSIIIIDWFTSEWVTNLQILTPNKGRFYSSRIHDKRKLLKLIDQRAI